MNEIDLTLPDFLNRKLNPRLPDLPDGSGVAAPALNPSPSVGATPQICGVSAVRIYLRNRLRDCPLGPGWHVVELVSKRKRKLVRFRVPGRKQCVRVPVAKWLELTGAQ